MASSIYTMQGLSFAYREHGARRARRHGAARAGEGVTPVFSGLDLAIPEGVVTTLIGANGSGKSTLFNLMTKNLTPDEGRVFLRRGDVSLMRLRDFSRLVAIVHQHNTAPADLAVGSLVGYGRNPHHTMAAAASTEEDERMVAWALKTAGLAGLEDRPVASLSGGQRQRAWIAMALAQGTQVLLLDEPTTYLDVRYQIETLRLVRRLNEEFGITVVMVLHDINQALAYSDHIVALADGCVAAQGAPEEVITPQTVREVYHIDLELTHVHGHPFVIAV